MVGLVIPLLLALPAPFAAEGAICDPASPARCEVPLLGAAIDTRDADQPRYATQAVVDCRAPLSAMGTSLPGLVGECDGTPHDASYRASRDPDSERAPGSLRPARRDQSGAGPLSACAGLPSEGGDGSTGPAPSQPLALFALPALPPASASRLGVESSTSPPTRQPRPLDRPPRA